MSQSVNTDIISPPDPWTLFSAWYAEALRHESIYPDAMMLATVGADGMPSLRTVLMKHFDQAGLVFHTNRQSRKGRELATHSQASVCFYWKTLQRQIRVEGIVHVLDDAASDAYFATRPRASQIGAWASLQSRPYDMRETFEKRIAEVEKQYEDKAVPRPPHWGGYRLAPSYFEFWQERLYRLHDRVTYSHPDGAIWNDDRLTFSREAAAPAWKIERLYP